MSRPITVPPGLTPRGRQKEEANMAKGHCFIAIGPYCWGRGKTRDEAVANCKKEWPKHYEGKFDPKRVGVRCFPDDATVGGLGDVLSIRHPADCPHCEKEWTKAK